MRYLSLFSGIEACSVAWKPLGWECVAYAEIEPFPIAVTKHHYPDIPNLGDVSKITDEMIAALGPIDLVVGGSPCQDLSVAGKRAGLAGARSGLFHEQLRIFHAARTICGARFLLWENVPGAFSSHGGRDFGIVVGSMAGADLAVPECGWGTCGAAIGANGLVEWRVLDAQHVRVQSHPRAVPQRRRRVFALLDSGNWRDRPPILLEPEGLLGHPAPRREAGQRVAGSLANRARGCGGLGTDFDCDGGLVAHSLRAEYDGSEDGTGRWTPLVPATFSTPAMGAPEVDGGHYLAWPAQVASTLNAAFGDKQGLEDQHALHGAPMFVPVYMSSGAGEVSPTLRSMEFDIAFHNRQDPDVSGDVTHPLGAMDNGMGVGISAPSLTASNDPSRSPQSSEVTQQVAAVHAAAMQVRRLTPRECERLQGFPDGWTDVPYRGKPAADGPRYKALGNSMAVNCMSWIGQRIQSVIDHENR